ncbi:Alkylated DNA repair protein [Melia azedarach]|uniref:Alkylated DNA repair protein n=1 Tax=Melia azedarach TaxID=155640 RepID=A0ACC1X0R4_MELAZ|nr:Alkylated DNA repair protein [Melia azedarach]
MFSGTSTNSDLSKTSIQIKQDDKFFSRLLSKENSSANPSFRVYYGGGAGAVPFLWESRPGTPKCALSETSLPPLTPPPSYYSNSDKNNKPVKKLHSRSKTSWPSSNFSLMVPITSPKKYYRARSRFSSRGSSFDSRADYEEAAVDIGSPNSTLCFGRFRGCYGG